MSKYFTGKFKESQAVWFEGDDTTMGKYIPALINEVLSKDSIFDYEIVLILLEKGMPPSSVESRTRKVTEPQLSHLLEAFQDRIDNYVP